jgi:hypothetical protein
VRLELRVVSLAARSLALVLLLLRRALLLLLPRSLRAMLALALMLMLRAPVMLVLMLVLMPLDLAMPMLMLRRMPPLKSGIGKSFLPDGGCMGDFNLVEEVLSVCFLFFCFCLGFAGCNVIDIPVELVSSAHLDRISVFTIPDQPAGLYFECLNNNMPIGKSIIPSNSMMKFFDR